MTKREKKYHQTKKLVKQMKTMLLSSQYLAQSVKRYFTDEEFMRNTKFRSLPIMEKARNIIIR